MTEAKALAAAQRIEATRYIGSQFASDARIVARALLSRRSNGEENGSSPAVVELVEALEQCAEALAFARDKLGMCGEGDGADRKADADDTIGSLPALIAARNALNRPHLF